MDGPAALRNTRLQTLTDRRHPGGAAENAAPALFILNERQHCTFMNSAAERLTGYTLADVQGRPLHDVIHHTRPDGRPYPIGECPIERAFDEDARAEGEEVFVHPDGRFYPVAYSASPIREAGRRVGTIVEVRDSVAERRVQAERRGLVEALELERARLTSVFQHAASYIAVVRGPDHVFELANPLYRRLAGDRPLLGRTAREALPELVDQGYIDLLDDVYRSGKPYTATEAPVVYQRTRDEPPSRHFINFVYQPLDGPDGTVSGILAHGVDVTEQVLARQEVEQARDLTSRLQELTVALAASSTPEDVAEVVVAQGVVATGAATGLLALRDGGEVVVLRQKGLPEDVFREHARFPLDTPGPAAASVRTGEAFFIETREEARGRFPRNGTTLETRAVAAVPLTMAGETIGAIAFTFTEERAFPRESRDFFLALGRQCAQALERARLVEAERESRALAERAADRARRVQRLTAQLNEAVGRAQIADVILEGGLAAVVADAGSLALVHSDADGRPERFEIIRTRGYGAEVAERYRTFPVEPGKPLSEAALRRETIAIGTPAEWARVFPTATEDLEKLGFQAFVAVPATVGERTLAALSFSFREPQEFDDATRTFLSTLSEQCALALERARLHEVELHQAEWHAALLETIQDAFVALDSQLHYTYVNPRAEALLGQRAADLLGRRMEEAFPDAPRSPVHEAVLRTLSTGVGTQVEGFSPVIGRWVEARIYPAPAGVSLVFQDITERRRAQDASDLLAEASQLLSASLDYEATLRTVADAAVPRLGDWCAVDVVEDPAAREWPPRIERLAVVHRDPAKLALAAELAERYPTDWAAETGFANVLRTGTPLFVPDVTDEMLAAGARDEEHLAILRALHFSSFLVVPLNARGLTVGALTLCMTESGRHYDARDLELVQDLASRAAVAIDNARLFRDAERARAEAESANRSKSEFLATMSHELRTPLNAIDGYAELIELGVHGPVTPAQAEALLRIRRSQKHLLGLINEVLNYARLETGAVHYDLAVVDVAAAIAEVESLVLPQVRARSLVLETEAAPLTAFADGEKLRQILVNLLSNAIKFTDPGGRIGVRSRSMGARVEIEVSDSGIGIAPDKLDAIFEPFVQVGRALNNPSEGTGLGLAISRDLARAMNGDLTVRSAPGEGSTFTLVLPGGGGGGGGSGE
jgi:PAS domain S-box-containing protein